MKKKSLSTALLFGTLALTTGLASTARAAQWEAIVFGGVDLANSPTNSFQGSFVSLSSALLKNSWNVQPLFGNEAACSGCGTSWDINPIATAANLSPSDIPHASKIELLKKLDAAIANLKSGDQLLVAINTHGMLQVSAGGADTTSLSVFDENDPQSVNENQLDSSGHQIGTMLVNDPDLLSRYQTLKDNGVKLAFGSDSCFSGPTAKVLEKYGCVVTQTSSQKYGLGSPVSDSLTDLMNADPHALSTVSISQKGSVSMEDLFMDVTTYATNGINSPYYTTPFAGVLEPQFSAALDEFDAVEGLSASWLLKLPSSEFTVQGDQIQITGSPSDLAALQSFVQQNISPYLNPDKDAFFQSIAAYYLRPKMYYLSSPQTDTPSDLVKHVMGATAELQTAQAMYQSISNQQATLLNNIEQTGLAIHYQLDQAYSDGQTSFQNALQTLNGKPIVVTGGWISVPLSVGAPTQQRFFAPNDRWFKSDAMTAASMIGQEMSKTYPQASSPAFQMSLANTIAATETAAWNSATPATQNALTQIQKLGDFTVQKQAILHSGSGLQFVQYAIEARMYAYLFHREQVGSSDVDVSNCQNFTLRNLANP